METKDIIDNNYGNKLRVRVCGIVIKNDTILLLKHKAKTPSGYLWLPPGGGLEFGESIENALCREMLEETGLKVSKKAFYEVTEHVSPPLHAIELFYTVNYLDGEISIGVDPELPDNQQLIEDLKWMSIEDITKLEDSSKHAVLKNIKKLKNIF